MTALTIENINAYFAIKTTSPFVNGYVFVLSIFKTKFDFYF